MCTIMHPTCSDLHVLIARCHCGTVATSDIIFAAQYFYTGR